MKQEKFQMPICSYLEEGTMMEIADSINLRLIQPDNIQWNFNENFNYFGDDLTTIEGVKKWFLPCIKSKADRIKLLDSMIEELNQYKTFKQTTEDIELATTQKIENLLEAFNRILRRTEAEPEPAKQSVIAEANPPKAEQKQGGIPDEFQTPEAKQVFQKAIKGGLLDENYMPTNLVHSVAQKALLAEFMFCECSTLKYATFERFWGMKKNSITSTRSKGHGVRGREPIYKCFGKQNKGK